MKEELEQKLYQDFPKVFAQHKLPMEQTCMCWGCEHGDGWEPIVRAAASSLEQKTHFAAPERRNATIDWIKMCISDACRFVEKKLHLKSRSLYTYKHRRYHSFAGWSVSFGQVKEKWGMLTIYYDIEENFQPEDVEHLDQQGVENERYRYIGFVQGVLEAAQHQSTFTCEYCGAPGYIDSSKRWKKTLCENCNNNKPS